MPNAVIVSAESCVNEMKFKSVPPNLVPDECDILPVDVPE